LLHFTVRPADPSASGFTLKLAPQVGQEIIMSLENLT